jgi:hypothetical protein
MTVMYVFMYVYAVRVFGQKAQQIRLNPLTDLSVIGVYIL